MNWKNATIKQWIFGITILSSMVLVCVTTIFLFWKGGRAVLALDSADLFETAAVYAPPKSYKRENPYESLEQFQTQGPRDPFAQQLHRLDCTSALEPCGQKVVTKIPSFDTTTAFEPIVYFKNVVNLYSYLKEEDRQSPNPLYLNLGDTYCHASAYLDGEFIGQTSRHLGLSQRPAGMVTVDAIPIPRRLIQNQEQVLVTRCSQASESSHPKAFRVQKYALTGEKTFRALEGAVQAYLLFGTLLVLYFAIYHFFLWLTRRDGPNAAFIAYCTYSAVYFFLIFGGMSLIESVDPKWVWKARMAVFFGVVITYTSFRFMVEEPISYIYYRYHTKSKIKKLKAAGAHQEAKRLQTDSTRYGFFATSITLFVESIALVIFPTMFFVSWILPLESASKLTLNFGVPMGFLWYLCFVGIVAHWVISQSKKRNVWATLPFCLGMAVVTGTFLSGTLVNAGVKGFVINAGGYAVSIVVLCGAITLGNQFTLVYKNLGNLKRSLEKLLDGSKELSQCEASIAALSKACEFTVLGLKKINANARAGVYLFVKQKTQIEKIEPFSRHQQYSKLDLENQIKENPQDMESFTYHLILRQEGTTKSNATPNSGLMPQLEHNTIANQFLNSLELGRSTAFSGSLLVPVLKEDMVLGFMYFEGFEGTFINSAEQNFLDTMAGTLGVAMENIFHSHHLQELVDQRTEALNQALVQVTQEKSKIQNILEHMQQGIMTFDASLSIDPEFSTFLSYFYGISKETIAGQNVMEFVFGKANEMENALNQTQEALKATVGENTFGWELNSDQLVKEATLDINGQKKIIALHWHPIINTQDVVEKILLSVHDVTEQKALEREIEKQKEISGRLTHTLSQLLKAKRSSLNTFFPDAHQRLKKIQQEFSKSQPDPGVIFVDMHTIKGGSRVLGLTELMNVTHLAENHVQSWRAGATLDRELVATQIQKLEAEVQFYQNTYQLLSGESNDSSPSEGIFHLSIALNQILGKIFQALTEGGCTLGGFQVEDKVIHWKPEVTGAIIGMVMHALNNSVDHGFVLPRKRGQTRAPREAFFHVRATVEGEWVILTVADNGAGFDLGVIREIAIKQGKNPNNMTESQLLQVLFGNGVSTAEQVSESSGRGVGLSAIAHYARELQGSAEILRHDGAGAKVLVRLPIQAVVANEPLEKIAQAA